jgi:C1A family cysteine protease
VKKILLATFMTLSVLLLSGTFSYADRLDEVKQAIKDQGKHWIAEETENSLVPEYEQGNRVGLIKPKLTGGEKIAALSAPLTGLPTGFDWSIGGSFNNGTNYVTPIRNQGNCGSCWAFATAGALESYTLIQGGDSTCILGVCDLSEQMLLACSGAGNCKSGGYIDAAANYIRDTGLPPENCYGYNIGSAGTCSPCNIWESQVHKIDAWAYVATTSPKVDTIKTALTTTGPLVTTMDVYQDFYRYYSSGVYSYTSGPYMGGHAVIIVGYQDDSTLPGGGYFRVKNSWGSNWGEAGFFKIAYSELASVVDFGDWTIAYQTAASAGLPAAPSGLVADAAFSSQINLSWTDNATNEDGFRIERCTGSGCTNFLQIGTVGANVATYANTGLTPGTTYMYRVRAYNTAGNSGYSNTANATTAPPPPPPAAPSDLNATAISSSQINLSWTNNATNEDGFKIESCTGVGCTKFKQIATVGPDVATFSNSGLRKGTTYTYRVRAYNTVENSAYSNVASRTTLR